MLPSTADRVPLNTCEDVNKQIRERTDANVAEFGSRSRAAIDARLEQLDDEWDVERTIEANASTICLVGLGLGTLPAVVAGFLLQHALQGWCPPIPILRRLGFRTQTEIEEERYALKAIRGDFEGAKGYVAALRAVRR